MPGGRLTLQERRDIAAGLAQGLGYAEIARRLHRSTSTISREVNRHGGHNGYRAGRANQEALRQAARRRATSPQRGTSAEPAADAHGRDRNAVRGFEQRLSEFMIETGFPRMMALVLIALYTSDAGSLTAAELVNRLHVSPASISKAVQYLERLEFVRRERDPQHRRERYIIDGDTWNGVWRRQAQSMAQWGLLMREGARVFDPATPAGARLDQLSQLLLFHHREMLAATERWRALVDASSPEVLDT